MGEKIVTLLSGGLDSAVLAAWAKHHDQGQSEVTAFSFDYGQRHKKELEAARNIAGNLRITHYTIDLAVQTEYIDRGWEAWLLKPSDLKPGIDPTTIVRQPLSALLTGSALTDEAVPVPEGHYADESMKSTVVPNRNAIFLSIAYGVAVAQKADLVLFGAHAGDHAIYPDCREPFVDRLNDALDAGNRWEPWQGLPLIVAPFVKKTKAEIVTLGTQLRVPFVLTWSCYNGREEHCGVCGTCVERKEAFQLAGIDDPTRYEA